MRPCFLSLGVMYMGMSEQQVFESIVNTDLRETCGYVSDKHQSSAVHNHDCDDVTATVMQLQCDCDQKWKRSFFCEVARGYSQSQCRNRYGPGRPAVALLFTVISCVFRLLMKATSYLLSYFYPVTSNFPRYGTWITYEIDVGNSKYDKILTSLCDWPSRLCRSHITVASQSQLSSREL